jgi:predicted  nucleic acid-binding Zn-ribbon protein
MNALIQKLIELQTVDLRAADLRKQIDAFPQQIAQIDHTVHAGREAVARAKQHVLDLQKDRKKLELDVEDWRGKIKKYKDQLFQVKSNEAYKALQEEIRGAEAEMGRAEDRLLEEMVGAEDADREVKEAERLLVEVEAAAKKDRERVTAEKAVVEKELAEVEAISKARLAELPGDLVDHYKRIARRHDGIALAPVRDEACSMCSVRIRPHVVQLLRQPDNEEIYHCETCTRILYFVEEQKPAEGTKEAPVAEAGS